MTTHFVLDLLIIITTAWLFGQLFVKLQMPAMLGEMVAGIIIGPMVLGIITPSESLEILADMGIFFVMFYTGMELDPKKLLENKWPSFAVAFGGFILPFIGGFFVAKIFGATMYQSLFVGMGVSITAIAVQAVVLHSLSINKTQIGHIIIGAAVVDDILALISMTLLLGLAKTGNLDFVTIIILFVKVSGFFVLTIFTGHFIMPLLTRKLTFQRDKGFTFAITAALAMAFLAELAGLHMIIGAFLAGQFIRKEIMDDKAYEQVADRFFGISYGFLVPIFFVTLSFHMQFSLNLDFLLFAGAVTTIAILGKLVGCGLGAIPFGFNYLEASIIGFGMNGRGAVELVVATVVIKLSNELMKKGIIADELLTPDQFSALVMMAFITTLMAPITLKWLVSITYSSEEGASFCKQIEKSNRI